jgi:6-phosphogluconolactonase/Glucosamine-6-phosphate isomerase/deaminase
MAQNVPELIPVGAQGLQSCAKEAVDEHRGQNLTSDRFDELSMQVAETVIDLVTKKPDACLGLPTGATPLRMYVHLAKLSSSKSVDWSHVRCFALDDYLNADDGETFQSYLEENLYKHLNLTEANKHNPRFVDDYDGLIAACGGLDLTVLGIGTNGHIAFNEPSTPMQSWTHCTWLEQSTRIHNEKFFDDPNEVPKTGVTMGISTILASKRIILMAFGDEKKTIIEKAFQDRVPDSEIPASFLLLHNRVNIFTDFDLELAG